MNINIKHKRGVVSVIILLIILSLPLRCIGHSGRTDSNGGHRDNKNASGLGSYHYHCGGNPPHLHDGGVCPYSSASQTTTTSYEPTAQTTTSSSQSKVTQPKTISVKSLNVDEANIELLAGSTKKINFTIIPENATDQSISWESSDTKVASVNSEGIVSANEVGEADITLESSNGIRTTVHVQVQPVKVTRIEINTPNIIAKEGERVSLSASVFPSNATYKELVWNTLDPEIATIEDNVIVAKSAGQTKIFCTSKDGVVSETEIKVESKNDNENSNTSSNGVGAGIATIAVLGGVIACCKKNKKQ